LRVEAGIVKRDRPSRKIGLSLFLCGVCIPVARV
jgi:hypothetical protein